MSFRFRIWLSFDWVLSRVFYRNDRLYWGSLCFTKWRLLDEIWGSVIHYHFEQIPYLISCLVIIHDFPNNSYNNRWRQNSTYHSMHWILNFRGHKIYLQLGLNWESQMKLEYCVVVSFIDENRLYRVILNSNKIPMPSHNMQSHT